MSAVIESSVSVVALTVGASVTVTHGLRDGSAGLAPTYIWPTVPTPIVVTSANATSITFTNAGVATASAGFVVAHWHSVQGANTPVLYWLGLGTAPYFPSWKTALDLDFSVQPNQLLNADGDYVIAGKTWTKANSAGDQAAMQIINGTGLRVTPKAGTDLWAWNYSVPCITIPLPNVVTGLDTKTPLRIWLYLAASNHAADYDGALFAIRRVCPWQSYLGLKRGWDGGNRLTGFTGLNNGSLDIVQMAVTPNVYVLEMPYGAMSYHGTFFQGAWAAGFPAFSALNSCGSCFWGGDITEIAGYVGLPAMVLLIGASRAGSATAYVADIGRVRVDYFG
jgi:hypothetical protein